jgi:hypothetical protein
MKWPDLETEGIAGWMTTARCGIRGSTGPDGLRADVAGRTSRGRGAAMRSSATVTTPVCSFSDGAEVVDDPPGARRAAGCAVRARPGDGLGFIVQADIVAGTVFPDAHHPVDRPDDGAEIGCVARLVARKDRSADTCCVHGGPRGIGRVLLRLGAERGALASAGYACLLPNPRGSVGRGHAFAQGVIGDGGGIDYRDIMAGVDHCVAEGIADPQKLGIAGLSYGGYMAGWAVGQTDRFGASVAMSVVSNYVSFHLTSEVWWYDQAILEGEWNDPKSQYVDPHPSRTHTDARRRPDPAGSRGSMHAARSG